MTLIFVVILVALVFEYINGFHDTANSIATVVSTKVLTPRQAIVMSASTNLLGALLWTAVAKTIAGGLVDTSLFNLTNPTLICALFGAIAWDLLTWYWGLPTSSSHALMGGYPGPAIARVAHLRGVRHMFDAILWAGWIKTIVSIFVAPLLGMVVAYGLMIAVHWMFRRSSPRSMDVYFRKLQLVSAAFFSFEHGRNDAQKTMGIITSLLVTSGYQATFKVPIWVILSAHAAIGLGTMSGGWRIVRTMGTRLTKLKPRGGFCAETGAALSILVATAVNQPVSTTHVIAGAIAGVGSVQRLKAVRWGLAANIVWAWVFTIPASALVAWLCFEVIRLLVRGV